MVLKTKVETSSGLLRLSEGLKPIAELDVEV